jgi:hypothetical protein
LSLEIIANCPGLADDELRLFRRGRSVPKAANKQLINRLNLVLLDLSG